MHSVKIQQEYRALVARKIVFIVSLSGIGIILSLVALGTGPMKFSIA